MNVAIIDDQEFIRYSVKKILKKRSFNIYEYSGEEENLIDDLALKDIKILILDVVLEINKTGIDILEEIRKRKLDIQVVLMTAFTTAENVIKANKLEVVEILKKPFEEEELLNIIDEIIKNNQNLDDDNIAIENTQSEFIGSFETMKNIYKKIGMAATNKLTVLVTGDTGTGKELVAQLIHKNSPNMNKPFISINCASIPAELFESQLFGHEKGSFTGANSQHIGYAQQVEGGTLFLDEIGELNIDLQSKILRFLENGSFRRVGGYKEFTFDGRIIAATNLNFQEAIENNLFREDLYFRLSMLNIDLPSLEKRKDDIPLLVEHFIKKANNDLNTQVKTISAEAIKVLCKHHWRGNIRELRNTIYNAVLVAKQDNITPNDLEYLNKETRKQTPKSLDTYIKNLLEVEGIENALQIKENIDKIFLQTCVQQCSNITHLAQYLNISRATLRKRLKSFGIEYLE